MKKVCATLLALMLITSFALPASACSILSLSDDKAAFAAANEDGLNSNANVWYLPGENGSYGAVFFGFEDAWVQAGMNEAGLFLDWATEEQLPVDYPETAKPYRGNYLILSQGCLNQKVLQTCATIEDALSLYQQYIEPGFTYAHIMIADKSGASVIIEPSGGKIEVIRKDGPAQYMTNFNISNSKMAGYSCERYSAFQSLLLKDSSVSADNAKALLGAVSNNLTIYSNIYDLKNGTVTVYFLHNFSRPLVINLKDELAKGRHIDSLKQLFSVDAPAPEGVTVNSRNPYALQKKTLGLMQTVFAFIGLLWPVIFLLRFLLLRRRASGWLPRKMLALPAAAAVTLTSLFCNLLTTGLLTTGNFLRYGFTLYQNMLFTLPYCIVLLSAAQIVFAVLLWAKRALSLAERLLYTLSVLFFLAVLFNLQSWCWHLF